MIKSPNMTVQVDFYFISKLVERSPNIYSFKNEKMPYNYTMNSVFYVS